MAFRRGLWIVLLCLACLQAGAQERKYAVMSLVGDGLLIVRRDVSTGSRIDRNRRDLLEINNPVLDNAMLLAVDDELRREDRGIKTLLLGVRDPALFALQARGLEAGSVLAPVLPALLPIARNAGATHLVLATKYRDEARLKMHDGSVGSGKIEGFGFYLDDEMKTENRDTRVSTQGFIAPFAYFSLTLVDVASGSILAQQLVRESHVTGNEAGQTPWGALTPEQKVGMLKDMIRREVAVALPALMAARR